VSKSRLTSSIDVLFRCRWGTLALLLGVLAAGVPSAWRAAVPSHSLELWFVDDDPALQTYLAFQEKFGNDEVIALGYRSEAGIVNEESLIRIASLTGELELVQGVDQVISLTNARDLVREGFFVRRITPVEHYGGNMEALRRFLVHSDLTVNRLISSDARMAMVWIRMTVSGEIDSVRPRVIESVKEAADRHLGPGAYQLGGTGIIYDGLNRITERDFGRFMALTYALVLVLLFFLFRRLVFVVYAVLVVSSATLATLAILGWMGGQLNMVSVMLPTVITILGIADVVHVLNRFGTTQNGSPSEHARRTLSAVVRPCLYTSVTTAAGFLSFGFTDMPILNDFGRYSAIGIMLAFVMTFIYAAVLLPAAFSGGSGAGRMGVVDTFGPVLERLVRFVMRKRGLNWGLVALLSAAALAGLPRVNVDTYTIGYLPADHRVSRDHEKLDATWGHYATLDLTIEPLEGRTMLDPDVLDAERAFSAEVREHPHVSGAFGLHNLIDRHSEVVRGPGRIAESADDIRKAVRILESQVGEEMRRLVSEDYHSGRITLTGAILPARALGRSLDEIRAIATRSFAGVAVVQTAGYPPLYVRIIDYILDAQISSFLLALLTIFVVILVLLRNVRQAAIAMVPNVFPVLIMVGEMAWFGIDLDVGTVTIAAIVLGLAVDDTIHLLVHYREMNAGRTWERRLVETVSVIGRSVVSTSLILALGFSVLLFAGVRTAVYFGVLTGVGVVAALVGDLIVLPLLLRAVEPRSARPS
jgi:predicted RND superfamily exporter protein